MPRPIDDDTIVSAVDLLVEGFPERGRAFWEMAFARMKAFGGNQAAGIPIGYLLHAEERPVGVVLTPASVRHGADGAARRVVNISSMYLTPDQRWQAARLFMAVLATKADAYTDLTPTPQVEEFLQVLGFRRITDGISVISTAIEAARGWTSARVVAVDRAADDEIPSATRRLLDAHAPFGGLAFVLRADGASHALLLKRTRYRGLPAARLLYAEDFDQMVAHLGAVSRALLGRGVHVLTVDIPVGHACPGLVRAGRGPRYLRGDLCPDGIDQAGTELALFDL